MQEYFGASGELRRRLEGQQPRYSGQAATQAGQT